MPRYTHGLTGHPLYRVWTQMKQRCGNINNRRYKSYGGRGIAVCDDWRNDFAAFHAWAVSHGYQKGLHIDRIDNDGDYTPDNCHYVTNTENNAAGRRSLRAISKSGVTGVQWFKGHRRWVAQIAISGKRIVIGYFDTLLAAREARLAAEVKYFGAVRTANQIDYDRVAKVTKEHVVERVKIPCTNKSGYVGVFWLTVCGKWLAYLTHNKKTFFRRQFATKEEAIEARKQAEIRWAAENNIKEHNL